MVVVAVYNNAGTILDVLSGLHGTGLPVIVVDDGSDDGTTEIVDRWVERVGGEACRSCRLEVNAGKAAALKAGFAWARELGHTHALTFDADGQHDVARVPAFLEALGSGDEEILVLGCREPLAAGYPLRNLVGRLTSNLAIRAQSGVRHGDAPCGMRVYPLSVVERVRCLSGRYAWEEEFITRASWAGCRVRSVTVPSLYAPAGERLSHYRFLRDWPEGIAIYLWLLLRALLPRPVAVRRLVPGLLLHRGLVGPSMAARTERGYLLLWMLGIVALSCLALLLPLPWWWMIAIAWVGLAWHGSVWLVGGALAGFWLGLHATLAIALVVPGVAVLTGVLLLITGARSRARAV